LITDSTSRIWVGTLGRGLWVGVDILSQLAHGLLSASGNTYAIAPGPNGQTLVLQDEKVLLLDDAFNIRLIEEHFPVAGWTAIWLDDHTIAIGSSTGLRIIDVATHTTTLSVYSLLSLRQWEFTNNRTLVRDAEGRLLCGVNAGLVRVDLSKLVPFQIPPRPQLLDVAWYGTTPDSVEGTTYQIRPGRWSLHVRAFAAWFVDHLKVRYQFKLIGFDDAWSDMQALPAVTYTSLPPGRYAIQCRSHSPLTGVGEAVTLCSVEVIAPWWTTGWAGLASRLDSGYRYIVHSQSRNAALLERNATLEQEIQDRTAKLRTTNESLQRTHDALEKASITDALTLAANRRGLERYFALEMKRAKRFDTLIGLIIIDIDHFKMVNDRMGHPAGDEYLCVVANILLAGIREGVDLVARYGGEEFVIVMHDAKLDDAIQLAERLRSAIAARKLPSPAAPMGQLTVSVGIDVIDPHTDQSLSELLQGADLALYEAKRSGRNRVTVAGHNQS
jgi:diguanylate cyclase (GGDEF)-like protein